MTILMASLSLFGCQTDKPPETTVPAEMSVSNAIDYILSDSVTEYVDIEMDSGKHIVIHLLPDVAPISVENVQKLASDKFYDGFTFHRMIEGLMIQGGNPKGDGSRGSKDTIKDEFAKTASTDYPALDGAYGSFGEVALGMDEVDRIAILEKMLWINRWNHRS